MKLFIFTLTMVFSISAFSGVLSGKELEAQNIDVSEAEVFKSLDEELPVVTMVDVKEYLSSADQNSTCLDEMVQRRKQLILKLSFAPVLGPLQVASWALGLGVSLGALGKLDNNPGNWSDLVGVAVGLGYGGVFSAIAVGKDTATSISRLLQLNTMIKSLTEQYLNRSGVKSDKFYNYYLKKSRTDSLDKEEFFAKLLEHDSNGSLCDGSMVKQPWFFKKSRGKKLKFRVATTKDFVKFVNKNY